MLAKVALTVMAVCAGFAVRPAESTDTGAVSTETANPAADTVIGFEEFTKGGVMPNPYVRNGFSLAAEGGLIVETRGRNNTVHGRADTAIDLTRTDGGVFRFKSIDLRDHFFSNAGTLTFQGLDRDGTTVHSHTVLVKRRMRTFQFDERFATVIRVRWSQGMNNRGADRRHNFDTIVVTPVDP